MDETSSPERPGVVVVVVAVRRHERADLALMGAARQQHFPPAVCEGRTRDLCLLRVPAMDEGCSLTETWPQQWLWWLRGGGEVFVTMCAV